MNYLMESFFDNFDGVTIEMIILIIACILIIIAIIALSIIKKMDK